MDPAGAITRCRSCGRKITFGRLANGKLIPLDLVSPVYFLTANGDAVRTNAAAPAPLGLPGESTVVGAYVSHFTTCPNADEHSKTKKRAPPAEQKELPDG